jgi:hypothetical protein
VLSHTWKQHYAGQACSLLDSYSLRLVSTLLNDLQHSRTIMSRGAQSAATKNQKAVEAKSDGFGSCSHNHTFPCSNHEELYHTYAAVPAELDLPGSCHIKLRLILQ